MKQKSKLLRHIILLTGNLASPNHQNQLLSACYPGWGTLKPLAPTCVAILHIAPQSTAVFVKKNSQLVPLRKGTYANYVHLKKKELAKCSHSPNIAKIVSKVWRFVMTTTYSVKSIMKGFTPPFGVTQSRSEDNYYPRTLVSSPPKSLDRIASFAGNNLLQKTLRSRLLGVRASIQRQPSIITEVC